MKNSQKGFVLPLVIAIIALLAFGGGLYFYMNRKASEPISANNNITTTKPILPATTSSQIVEKKVVVKPNAPKISFQYSDAGIYVADIDGGNKELIYKPDPNKNAAYFSWDWSPDDKFIVTNLGVMVNVTTKQQTKIPQGFCQDWSPDGKKIIYQTNGISVMDQNGKNSKQLTSDGDLCRGVNDVSHWLPDGNSFIYASKSGINKFDLLSNKNSLIYNSNTNQINVLSVTVSKDGTKVAFVGRPKINPLPSKANIYIANVDGSNVQQLTNLDTEVGQIVFTKDGKQIIFSVNNTLSQYTGLSALNIQDKTIKILSNINADDYSPPTVSSDGQLVAYDNFMGTKIINLTTGMEQVLPYKVWRLLFSR